jgi:hypothetical protein
MSGNASFKFQLLIGGKRRKNLFQSGNQVDTSVGLFMAFMAK